MVQLSLLKLVVRQEKLPQLRYNKIPCPSATTLVLSSQLGDTGSPQNGSVWTLVPLAASSPSLRFTEFAVCCKAHSYTLSFFYFLFDYFLLCNAHST